MEIFEFFVTTSITPPNVPKSFVFDGFYIKIECNICVTGISLSKWGVNRESIPSTIDQIQR
ncbi:hypothetical protein T02_4842 [Trichinella nativa]|uniref:Uncharacterized protein n=1 Tax=Trichinella nativa TaxID=6335 RepID=A0A0V1LHU8_9BILA|nr:hypothetical protein T02_4842 [Trichinella nativa]